MGASNNVSGRSRPIPNVSCQALFLLDFELLCVPKAVLFKWLFPLLPVRGKLQLAGRKGTPWVIHFCCEPDTRRCRASPGVWWSGSRRPAFSGGGLAPRKDTTGGSAVHGLGSRSRYLATFLPNAASIVCSRDKSSKCGDGDRVRVLLVSLGKLWGIPQQVLLERMLE